MALPTAEDIKNNGTKSTEHHLVYKYNDKYYIVWSDNNIDEKDSEEEAISIVKGAAEVYTTAEDAKNEYFEQMAEENAKRIENLKALSTAACLHTGDVNSKFVNQMKTIATEFNQNRPLYTLYLDFKILSNGTQTLINTASGDWLENCLVGFTHNMNGSGTANTFTVDIVFKPIEVNISKVNELEEKLLTICKIEDPNSGGKNLKSENVLFGNCSFQYGYNFGLTSTGVSSILSEVYQAQVLKYDAKIDSNGNLHYTIHGTSSVYNDSEIRLTSKDEYLVNAEFKVDVSGNTITTENKENEETTTTNTNTESGFSKIHPLVYLKNIFDEEFKDSKKYDILFLDNCYKNSNINDGFVSAFSTNDFTHFTQKNLFQVVSDILAGTADENTMLALSQKKMKYPQQLSVFGFYVTDNKSICKDERTISTFVVYKLPNAYNDDSINESEQNIIPEITFSWFSPSSSADVNHLVHSWNPQYEGSVLMQLAAVVHNNPDMKHSALDNDGNLQYVPSMQSIRTCGDDGSRTPNDMLQEFSQWTIATQYPYNATMVIQGVPAEIALSSLIKVIPTMGHGAAIHHSQGDYIVLSKKDVFNSNGSFTSELSLFKSVKGWDPALLEWETYTYEDDDETDTDNDTSKEDPNPTTTGPVIADSDKDYFASVRKEGTNLINDDDSNVSLDTSKFFKNTYMTVSYDDYYQIPNKYLNATPIMYGTPYESTWSYITDSNGDWIIFKIRQNDKTIDFITPEQWTEMNKHFHPERYKE